jgi:nicotinamide-nucleotide amidase
MTPNNRRQAMVPAKGQVVANDSGTAPAFFAVHERAKIFLMPGVPREVRWLVENRLLDTIGRGDREVTRRTIKVIGIGESKLEDMIKEVVAAHLQVRFGYRTQGIENHVKLMAEGPEREQLLHAAEEDLKRVLEDRIFGKDDDTLEEVVGRALRGARATVATAESCTGGWIAKMLTDQSGSSEYVRGGVVSYANDAKVRLLGVRAEDISEHGAVSEEVVKQMATGVRERLVTDYGIGVTGVAGPTGGTETKPVGTVWIAVASADGVETQLLKLPVRSRDWIREMSARAALGLLRRKILGSDRKTTATS